MKLVVFLAALATGLVVSFGATVDDVKRDDIVEQTLELGEAVEQERAALSARDQAMLEAIVDEAIRQEELLRNRRTSGSSGNNHSEAKDRFSSSFDHDAPPDDYGPPPIPTSYKDKSFSVWSFKKMVFNALLQAIKAITGGVIALKGQIVKVKGHLVAAKGKLLETKGDAITEFGKHLATKALLSPVHVSNFDHNTPAPTSPPTVVYGPPVHASGPYPPSVSHSSYGSTGHSTDYVGPPPSSYGGPSHSYGPPPSGYGGPSSHQYLPPTNSYGAPVGFSSPTGPSYPHNFGPSGDGWNKRGANDKAGLPDGAHAGLIVLKPIKSNTQHSVYRPPQAFKKSSNSRVDEVEDAKDKTT